MLTLTVLYTNKNSDNLFDSMKDVKQLCNEKGVLFIEHCIDGDKGLEDLYDKKCPVIRIGAYTLTSPFTLIDIEVAINSALEKQTYYQSHVDKSKNSALVITALDKF